MSLRTDLKKLAQANPELRPHLLPLLRKTAVVGDAVQKAVVKLVSDIKAGKGIDPGEAEKTTDGVLLAQVLIPILQSVAMKLKDARGFRAKMKKSL